MNLEGYKPQDVYETEIVRDILATAWRDGADMVDGIGGVRTVTPFAALPEDQDCTGFVFGPGVDGKEATDEVMQTWQSTSEPVPGALAVYLSGGKYPMHIGVVQENGLVHSRWDSTFFRGNVYEHLPLAVPTDYGDTVVFYTPVSSK